MRQRDFTPVCVSPPYVSCPPPQYRDAGQDTPGWHRGSSGHVGLCQAVMRRGRQPVPSCGQIKGDAWGLAQHGAGKVLGCWRGRGGGGVGVPPFFFLRCWMFLPLLVSPV